VVRIVILGFSTFGQGFRLGREKIYLFICF